MKINPLDKQPLVQTKGTAPGRTGQTDNFDEVLKKTLQSTQSSNQVNPTGKTASPVLNRIQACLDIRQDVYKRLDRILDTFENYQQLLGDRRSSLKQVSCAMDDLKSKTQDLETMLEKVEEGDPLKAILNETLVAVSKEVFHFDSGAYID